MQPFDSIYFGEGNTRIDANVDTGGPHHEWQTKELYGSLENFAIVDDQLVHLNGPVKTPVLLTATFEIHDEDESLVVTVARGELVRVTQGYARFRELPELQPKYLYSEPWDLQPRRKWSIIKAVRKFLGK
jgi:hypothetical protein